jgi:hypothetical protein
VACDHDTATTADYGQWTPGKSPNVQEDDVPLTDTEIAKVAAATRDALLARVTDDPTKSDKSTLSLLALLWDAGRNAGQANANTVKLLAQQSGLTAALTALAKDGGLTAEQITAASEAGARAALAEFGDVLTRRRTDPWQAPRRAGRSKRKLSPALRHPRPSVSPRPSSTTCRTTTSYSAAPQPGCRRSS